jgi:predicted dienelactone hydrolase
MGAARYRPETGEHDVREAHDVLADHPVAGAHRPLTCRWPAGMDPVGIVIFCHGLGSNGGEYAALSSHWAGRGYLVVHPTFGDSIDAVARAEPLPGLDPNADLTGWTAVPELRARMHQILHTPAYWIERIEVVRSTMNALPAIAEASCGGPATSMSCAIAGHSFGAYTAQLLAGAVIDLPDAGRRSFRDDRFAAAILLSAQGRDQQGLGDGSWDDIRRPLLNLTGTLDQGAKGGDWHWKSEPYDLAPPGGKYLAVLDDGDHYLGGFADSPGQRQVPNQRHAVYDLTLAFLDAHVRGNAAARAWLNSIDGAIGDCPLLFKHK